VLTFSGWQWAGVVTALGLPELALRLPNSYFVGRQVVFGLSSLGMALGLYFRRPWAPGGSRWVGLGFIGWNLIENALFAQNTFAIRTLPTTAIFSLLLWGVLVFALRRPTVRNYFQEHPA
jgi:hypothetical protein